MTYYPGKTIRLTTKGLLNVGEPVTEDATVTFSLADAAGTVQAGPVSGEADADSNDWYAFVDAPATPATYAILAEAVVGTAKGGWLGSLTVEPFQLPASNVSPGIGADGAVVVNRGDAYLAAISTALGWSSYAWPDLTTATVALSVTTITETPYTFAMTVVTAAAPGSVRLELTGDQTAELPVFTGRYEVIATIAGNRVTLAAGTFYAKD